MRNRLTPYGQKCREFRSRYKLVMADQANGLDVSVAYISAIELGKRPIPHGYTAELAHWLSLPESDSTLLSSLEISSKRSVEVSPRNSSQATLAHEFAASLDDIPTEGVEFLRACLATARSTKNPLSVIRQRAMLASAVFNLDVQSTFDVLKIIENKLCLVDKDFSLQVEMDRAGQAPIYSDSDGKKVDSFISSQWFYTEASRQTPASRFALAHEIAHWILHPYSTHPYSRSRRTNRILSASVATELEADDFAREFLLPLAVVERFATAEELAKGANVPLWLAVKRFNEVKSLTASERDQMHWLAKLITERLAPRNSPTDKRSRKSKSQGMTLFEYADVVRQSGTRADLWFKFYGFRG